MKNPSKRLRGFSLPRKEWVLLNRIRCNVGRSGQNMNLWKYNQDPSCDCGEQIQSMKHIIFDCPIRNFNGRPKEFFTLSEEALGWIQNLDIRL